MRLRFRYSWLGEYGFKNASLDFKAVLRPLIRWLASLINWNILVGEVIM